MMKKNTMRKAVAIVLFLLATPAALLSGDKGEDDRPPKTIEDLKRWLPGTEWRVKEDTNTETTYTVRRFYRNGQMRFQKHKRKWDDDTDVPVIVQGWLVRDYNKIQYGSYLWMVELNDDYDRFEGKCHLGKCKAEYLGRFELP